MAITVVMSARAERALDVISQRWNREHGADHQNPLLVQLLDMITLLSVTPEMGIVVPRRGRAIWRRWLLRAGWHVYYTYDPERELVALETIWSARRRRPPRRSSAMS